MLFAFGALPIGAIGPNEVQQWISQMAVDGYDHATMRAKRSLLKTILQGAVDQGWLSHNVVERARLPRAVSVPWERLSALVLSNSALTSAETAELLLELASQSAALPLAGPCPESCPDALSAAERSCPFGGHSCPSGGASPRRPMNARR